MTNFVQAKKQKASLIERIHLIDRRGTFLQRLNWANRALDPLEMIKWSILGGVLWIGVSNGYDITVVLGADLGVYVLILIFEAFLGISFDWSIDPEAQDHIMLRNAYQALRIAAANLPLQSDAFRQVSKTITAIDSLAGDEFQEG